MNTSPTPSPEVAAAAHQAAAIAIEVHLENHDLGEDYPHLSEAQAGELAFALKALAQDLRRTAQGPKVLIFLDVDGVISPLPSQHNPWAHTPYAVVRAGYGMDWHIHQPVAEALKRWNNNPAVQLLWISAWEEATEQLNHGLGLLAPVPWLPITEPSGDKTPTILNCLAQNPGYARAVAVDDEFTRGDVKLLYEHQVHAVAPAATGLNQGIILAIDRIIEETQKEGNHDPR